MRLLRRIKAALHALAIGPTLARAVRQNDEAAARLDAAVREVLGK
ncbi:MAG: hypothetical protein AAFQ79_11780 [Pseudomonadota bacterium]